MMVRFFTHGDGSGRSAVEYLLASEVPAYTEDRKRIPGKTVRREVAPEVLSGDPDLTCHLIDSNTRKWRYTSGVVAFHVEDNPSEAQQADVMREFETAAFAGLEADQANILWVRHQHMGNVELHFLIPRVELYGNRSLTPRPQGRSASSIHSVTIGIPEKAGSVLKSRSGNGWSNQSSIWATERASKKPFRL